MSTPSSPTQPEGFSHFAEIIQASLFDNSYDDLFSSDDEPCPWLSVDEQSSDYEHDIDHSNIPINLFLCESTQINSNPLCNDKNPNKTPLKHSQDTDNTSSSSLSLLTVASPQHTNIDAVEHILSPHIVISPMMSSYQWFNCNNLSIDSECGERDHEYLTESMASTPSVDTVTSEIHSFANERLDCDETNESERISHTKTEQNEQKKSYDSDPHILHAQSVWPRRAPQQNIYSDKVVVGNTFKSIFFGPFEEAISN